MLGQVPARELYERTGIQILPINTIFELAALAADDDAGLAAAETLLMIPDLVHYWLAGTRVAEYTNATTTQCLDAASGAWADDLSSASTSRARILPELVRPGTVLGPLTPGAADETRLGGARVIAVASHDTASAVAAIPLRGTASAYISAGTWSLVGVELDRPLIDDRTFAANLTNEGGVDGTFRLLRNVTGSGCCTSAGAPGPRRETPTPSTSWWRSPATRPRSGARSSRTTRLRSSGRHAGAHSRLLRRDGPAPPGEAGAVARCILESLALKHAQTLDVLGGATGVAPTESTSSAAARATRCSAAGRPTPRGCRCSPGPEEATLLGNLLVQAIALGEIGSLAEGREVVRRRSPATFTSRSPRGAWDEARQRFAALAMAGAVRRVTRESIGVLHGIPAPDDRWDRGGGRGPRRARRAHVPLEPARRRPRAREHRRRQHVGEGHARRPRRPRARVLWVKGSGTDLATITPARLRRPPPRRRPAAAAADAMDDATMVDYLLRSAVGPTSRGRRSRRCCTPSCRRRRSTTRTPTRSSR